MKKIIFLFMAATVLLSCQNKKDYTITGTVADAAYEGTNVYIQQVTDDAMVSVDTAVVTNGAFSFKGEADTTVLRFIALDETVNQKQQNRVPVLIEPGKIDVKFDSLITVQGTKVNDDYTAYRMKQRDLNKEARAIVDQYNSARTAGTMTDAIEEETRNAYDKISAEMDSLSFNFVKDNVKNDLGKYIFSTQWRMFTPEKQKELLGMTDDAFKATPAIQRLATRVQNYENVAIGKKFVDFTLQDPDGKTVSLSDYAGKGKYVLVDFWASWCGPCRREMPNLVEAYKKYKNKGFEIVGVSLDKEQADWVKGVKELNITWPQMSDLKFWESSVVDLYVIEGIPHLVLLDKEGVIIAKNLHGEELNAKLAELMP